MVVGYDPISLEECSVTEWISEHPDNFVLIADADNLKYQQGSDDLKGKVFCLKKSYFLNPQENEYYVQCRKSKGQFLPKESLKGKNYYLNLGPYFGEKGMIPTKELARSLNKKQQVYSISRSSASDKPFIGLTWLNLSTIGISKGDLANQHKSNLPFKDDVYFENLMASALYQYSGEMYQPINNFLRMGPDYWDTVGFGKVLRHYGQERSDMIDYVKRKIATIDKCFLEAAPRLEGKKRVYFRGMRGVYDFRVNSEVIVTNYTSVSSKIQKAYSFTDVHSKCCLYELHLPEGMPYINMINTTIFKSEAEILLPRNLVFTYLGNKPAKWGDYDVMKIEVDYMTDNQFKIDDGCRNHPMWAISSLPKTGVLHRVLTGKPLSKKQQQLHKKQTPKQPPKSPKPHKSTLKSLKKSGVPTIQMAPKDVVNQLEITPLVNPVLPVLPVQPGPKKKRCPKGTRRDKVSGLCVSKTPVKVSKGPASAETKPKTETKTKVKRCPNGTRRNKKTMKCEPKSQ